jgi:HK97 family phage prohead protease
MADNKFKFLVESFQVSKETDGTKSTKVSGLALPFEKVSRNGFSYNMDSIKETYKTLEGAPVCFNHDTNQVLGHVTNVSLGKEGLMYEMDLDPEESIVKKVKRGDITKVSIQCIYDQDKSNVDESGVVNAYIKEFLELSIVTIPGFADTSAQVVES